MCAKVVQKSLQKVKGRQEQKPARQPLFVAGKLARRSPLADQILAAKVVVDNRPAVSLYGWFVVCISRRCLRPDLPFLGPANLLVIVETGPRVRPELEAILAVQPASEKVKRTGRA